jgi:hypothetical protein
MFSMVILIISGPGQDRRSKTRLAAAIGVRPSKSPAVSVILTECYYFIQSVTITIFVVPRRKPIGCPLVL